MWQISTFFVAQGETTAATGQVDSIVSRVTYGTSMVDANNVARYGFAYDYDANGNITNEYAVAADGTRTLRYRYTYDEANQLTRVDDNTQGKTHVYQYDRGGNRVSEKIYAYTLGTISGDPQQTVSSYYGPRVDSVEGLFRGWYDVLRTYDGKGIQYDRSGNPVSYDGKTFTWNGKLLTKVTAADGSYTEFSYDADGIRTQKRQYTEDGEMEYYVNYVWQDGLLTHQSMTYYFHMTLNGTEKVVELPFTAKFVYDESNTPVGCLVNDEMALAFVRNLQGDIIAVVNQEGTALLEYSYDPWGKVTITQNGENLTEQERQIIAVLCPFAYRGYNYDFTTGLYYLQSRYYNPEWGRFLNVDDTNILFSTQGTNLGANLFAYCENDPVNQVDYEGRSPSPQINVPTYILACGLVFVKFDDSIEIRTNSYKGGIAIDLDDSVSDGGTSITFSESILALNRLYGDKAFTVLTAFVEQKFYQKFPEQYRRAYGKSTSKRNFLFSHSCIKREIKHHCLARWNAEQKTLRMSLRLEGGVMLQTMVNYLWDNKTNPIKLRFWDYSEIMNNWDNSIKTSCAVIEIYEQDANKPRDAIAFDYYTGIRWEYFYSMDDPYYNPITKLRGVTVREDWLNRKIG